MLPYVFLVIYVAAAAANVYGCRKGNGRLSDVTKPSLLLLLIIFFLLSSPEKPDAVMIGALGFCWLGDVLLMFDGNAAFAAGGVAFMGGHVFLIIAYAARVNFERITLAVLIPACLVYLAAAVAVMRRAAKEAPKLLRIPVFVYLLCNAVMNAFAILQLSDRLSAGSVLVFLGAALFFVSDCALFLMLYDKKKSGFFNSSFTVMLTYTAGVLFITLGMLLLA